MWKQADFPRDELPEFDEIYGMWASCYGGILQFCSFLLYESMGCKYIVDRGRISCFVALDNYTYFYKCPLFVYYVKVIY